MHVDGASGKRERVDVGEIRDAEAVRIAGPWGLGREPLAHALHVLGRVAGADERNPAIDDGGRLRSDLDVLLGREEIEAGTDARLRETRGGQGQDEARHEVDRCG